MSDVKMACTRCRVPHPINTLTTHGNRLYCDDCLTVIKGGKSPNSVTKQDIFNDKSRLIEQYAGQIFTEVYAKSDMTIDARIECTLIDAEKLADAVIDRKVKLFNEIFETELQP